MSRSIDKASVSFRIGTPQWLPEARFVELLDLFGRHPGVTDELAFFTSETHAPLPLTTIRERAEVLGKRMDEARRHGYRAGINVLATIGHHNENLANSLGGDYTRMTAPDGRQCLGSYCPNDERFRQAYVAPLYKLVADAGPEFIWIDDDVRLLGHMPIPAGCFCDRCLALFAEENGGAYSRAALWQALNQSSLDEKLALRRAWLDHNRRTLTGLFRLIEATVHTVRPDISLGFMTGDRFYEGYDFASWAEALAGPRNVEVMWRPGGGFYADEKLDGLVEKSHDIGRQVSQLPDAVVAIQSEIENFPYQRLKKAARTTALEAASHIAAGCTGAAFNVLSMYDEPLNEYEPLVAGLRRARPFLDLMAHTLGRSSPTGVYTGWTGDSYIAHGAESDWFRGGITSAPAHEILQLGIPAAYSLEHASVTALAGDLPLALSDAEIRRVLSSGVYLDPQALTRLNEMGYGALTGFQVERFVREDAIEQFCDHPLNGAYAGRLRDCRQSFLGWLVPAAVLQATDGAAQSLSRIVDYAGKEVGPCCSGTFENALGGRVFVAGYYPWTYLQSLSKAQQIKAIFRWLSGDTLDAYVSSFHRINLWVRRPGTGRVAVALLNASLDPAEGIELLLRTEAGSASVYDMQCGATQVYGPQPVATAYRRFILPRIPPWHMHLVVAEVQPNA